MTDDLEKWLDKLDLEKYAAVFAEHEVDLRDLPHLADADLRDLGLPLGPRRRLLAAITSLDTAANLVHAEDYSAENSARMSQDTSPRAAERRQLTVLFCDLVGSTALSQRLDPEDLRNVLRRYQDAVAGIVIRYEGHVAKFLGDGVLAYFGWPQAHEDDATRAVHAALEIDSNVAGIELNDSHHLSVRIGIATGRVVVGDLVGETGTDAEAVTGETPNLAARLQGVANSGEVLIDASTTELVNNVFELDQLADKTLKGFAKPIPVWQVIAERTVEKRLQAARRAGLTTFVGREHEIGLLLARWELARAGEGQVVYLSGPPGIGKSRLVSTVMERLEHLDHQQLYYQCSPYHQTVSFYPVIRQLEEAAAFVAEDSVTDKLGKLDQLLGRASSKAEADTSYFAELLSLPTEDLDGPGELSPMQRRKKVIAAILWLLLSLAKQRPLAILLEDAHWIDPSTEELIGELIKAIGDACIFVLVTCRPHYSPPWHSQSNLTSLSLNYFSRAQSSQLVRAIAGGKFNDKVIESVVERASGVPLYVEELTKFLLEEERDADTIEIPSTLQASLLSRLDRLGDAKYVAQVGSVIGREFTADLLSGVAAIDRLQLSKSIDQLVQSELLLRVTNEDAEQYLFRHALIRDAAYNSLLRSQRQQIHAAVAKELESIPSTMPETEPEVLAFHYAEAGIVEKAIDCWYRAGAKAIERSANEEAVEHLTRALALIKTVPRSKDVAERELQVLTLLSPAQMVTKGRQRELLSVTLERAKTVAQEINKSDRIVPATLGLWLVSLNQGDLARSEDLTRDLFEISRDQDDKGLLLQSYHAAWTIKMFEGDFDATLDYVRSGVELYDQDRHKDHKYVYLGHDPLVCAKALASVSHWMNGSTERATVSAGEALRLAEESNHDPTLVHALLHVGNFHALRRKFGDVASVATRILELATKLKMRPASLGGEVLSGWAMAMTGSVFDGLETIRPAVLAWEDSGAKLHLPQRLCMLGDVLGLAKEFEEAIETYDRALGIAAQTGESWYRSILLYQRADLLLRSGRSMAEVEEAFIMCIRQAKEQKARAVELRATVRFANHLSTIGNDELARKVLANLFSSSTRGLEPRELAEAESIMRHLSVIC